MCAMWIQMRAVRLEMILMLGVLEACYGIIQEECEEGWKMFGFNCYRFFPHAMDFQRAKETCESNNATLSSVWNSAERRFILDHVWKTIKREKSAWLGLVGDGKSSWHWLDGSSMEDFKLYPSGINVEDCGAITGWNAVGKYSCYNDFLAAFFCKRPLVMLYGIGSLENLNMPKPKPNMLRMKTILFERIQPSRIKEYNEKNKHLITFKVSQETDCAFHCFRRDECKGFKLICLLQTKCQHFACILLSFETTMYTYK